MCNGKCRECRRLKVPCRTINDHFTAYCFECDRFGMQGNSVAEVYPEVVEEIEMAKDSIKRMGRAWAVDWHGKAIVKEAERQEAKSVG